MRRALLVWTALLLAVCSGPAFVPETPAPSDARIRELARLERPVDTPERRGLEIQVYPRFVLAGHGAWVRCFVPQRADHRWLSYGIAARRVSWVQLDGERAATSFETFIESISCGEWDCQVSRSDTKVERRTYRFKSVGPCNSEPAGDAVVIGSPLPIMAWPRSQKSKRVERPLVSALSSRIGPAEIPWLVIPERIDPIKRVPGRFFSQVLIKPRFESHEVVAPLWSYRYTNPAVGREVRVPRIHDPLLHSHPSTVHPRSFPIDAVSVLTTGLQLAATSLAEDLSCIATAAARAAHCQACGIDHYDGTAVAPTLPSGVGPATGTRFSGPWLNSDQPSKSLSGELQPSRGRIALNPLQPVVECVVVMHVTKPACHSGTVAPSASGFGHDAVSPNSTLKSIGDPR